MGCLHSLFNTHYYMRFAADGNVDHLTRVRLYSAGCHAFFLNKHSSFRFFGNVLVIIFMDSCKFYSCKWDMCQVCLSGM